MDHSFHCERTAAHRASPKYGACARTIAIVWLYSITIVQICQYYRSSFLKIFSLNYSLAVRAVGRVSVSVQEAVVLKSSVNFFIDAFAKLLIEAVKGANQCSRKAFLRLCHIDFTYRARASRPPSHHTCQNKATAVAPQAQLPLLYFLMPNILRSKGTNIRGDFITTIFICIFPSNRFEKLY